MVSCNFATRVICFLPWGPGRGLPEASVPGVMYGNEWWIPARHRAATKLRVLADGRPQLLVPAYSGARVIGLGETAVQAEVQVDAGSGRWVQDAVLGADQSVITLERTSDTEFFVKQTGADGTTGWELSSAEPGTWLGEDGRHSRLLSAPGGRIYLASGGSPARVQDGGDRRSLVRVDDGSGDCLFQWEGASPIMLVGGGIGFARYDQARKRTDWVTVNLDVGSEVVAEPGPERGVHLAYAIGADGDGNVFQDFGGDLVRLCNNAVPDWQFTCTGIVVSEQHGITTMSLSADRQTAWLDDARRIEVDRSGGTRRGYLVNRTDEGGYVLYQRTKGDFGTLVHLDQDGEVIRSEPAPEDVWFANSQAQRPSAGSVTRDGEVLLAVHGSGGVHVVGIRPEPSVTGS
jgi:hypothetical protein